MQEYLKEMGVITSNMRKEQLIKLCETTPSLNIEVDPDGIHEDHCFVITHVKPRTNDNDPISKLPYYKLRIIFDKHDYMQAFTRQIVHVKGGLMDTADM